jgi:serine/threonine protein kinase
MLKIIEYLHSNEVSVCHRDTHSSNVMVKILPRKPTKPASEPDDVKVTLIDFNVSRRFREKNVNKEAEAESPAYRNILMLTHTGAAAFTAPEINLGFSYTEKVDMWGVGCILYNAIFNDIPFP